MFAVTPEKPARLGVFTGTPLLSKNEPIRILKTCRAD
jgi:hypothetical protein